MKRFGMFMLAATSLTLVATSCSEAETEEVMPDPVTYTLDAANSSIEWKGMMSPEYFHTGTVKFSEGTLTMIEDSVTGGSFTVDMTTITAVDPNLDSMKSVYLAGHLTGTIVDEQHPENMFFQTPKFPNVKVTLGEYKDGKLSATFDIVGKQLTQEIPVTITSDENGASISGDFELDLTSLGLMGFQKDPNTGAQISPKIGYKLNAKLTK